MKINILLTILFLSVIPIGAQKAPQPKQQWEYLVISPGKAFFTSIDEYSLEPYEKLNRYADALFSDTSEACLIEIVLDRLGSAGWELSGIIGQIGGDQQYVFKRILDSSLIAAENKKAKAAATAALEKRKLIPKIGLSFSDFASERWPSVRDEMTSLLKAAGYDVFVQEANHDSKLQSDQIKSMVAMGANVIIVVAEDGIALASTVDEIAKKGVKVIAYDRLVSSANLTAFVSFDAVEVGRNQAKGILAMKNYGNFVLLGGSPSDNNAHLLRVGQLEILQPLIDSGKITVVADQWVENWDPANAKQQMEHILTVTKDNINAVVASTDGIALGAIEALRDEDLAGKVPISGQDATEAGCNSIARGELTVTILKDTRNLTPIVCDLAIKIAKKEIISDLKSFALADLAGDMTKTGFVPCRFLDVFQITKDNLKTKVIDTGFQSYARVYAETEYGQDN